MCRRGFNATRAIAALVSSLATVSVVSAQVIYVNGACGDDGWHGTSAVCSDPHGPKSTIQAAIDASADGDTIIVAEGTYAGPGNRELDFAGRTITIQNAGGTAGCIIDCEAASRAFHFHSGETAAARVDGFTVRNGQAVTGSAILCELGSGPTITNCVFTANHTTGVTAPDFGGTLACLASAPTIAGCVFQANTASLEPGAVLCLDGGDAEFTNCRFEDNTAQQATALLILRSSPTFTDCQFIRNEASLYCCGGGVAYDNCSVQFTRCTFLENVSLGPNGVGGLAVQLNSQAEVRDCEFIGNVTASGGGGLWGGDYAELTVTNTTFLDNQADTGSGGGLSVVRNSRAYVRDCVFLGNLAGSNNGGGLIVSSTSQADLRDCVLIGNAATHGGALRVITGATATISNCTLAANEAASSGGAISTDRDSPTSVTNCVLWGNDAPLGPQIALGYPNASPATMVTVSFSDVQGGQAGIYVRPGSILAWGEGNVDAQPLFVRDPNPGPDGAWGTPDDDYGDLRLLEGSPCIDAGDPAFAPPPCEHDLDGACRVWDGNDDSLPRVDMGAYEFDAAMGDLDADCSIGLSDLTVLLAHFGMTDGATRSDGDLDGDGDVDLSDLTVLLANFGSTCP